MALTSACISGLIDLQARSASILEPAASPGKPAKGHIAATAEADDLVAYVAPEVLHGGPQSAASDCYSFGFLLFELLTVQLAYVSISSRVEGLDLALYMANLADKGIR